MAGYTRNDTSNNIATGNVINAADLDGEFDALVAAFHASTGHTHDGTAANGAPITKIGPAQDLVISTGAITPKTDNTVDLGSSSFEFKDLYIDGTANIDALVADTADINAGTIDGVTLGTNSAVTEAQIDNININGNTISSTDTNGNISLVPNGTGDVILTADTVQVGDSNTDVTVTTNGTGDLIFNTNAGTNSGVIRIYDGANGNIALTPNGTGEVDISKVDIDSGAIDGTAIGANSASTGAFTTLSASSTVTLSGGTANGVLYLNGSKVATSGSALTFDGSRLAIGGGTNGSHFTVRAAGAMAGFDTGTTNDGRIEYAYNGTNIFYTGIDSTSLMTMMARSGVSLAFGANGSEQMRLTSTGLGIGTSSPGSKLQVTSANGAVTLDSGTGESHYIDITHKGSYSEVNGIRFNQGSTTYGNNQILFRAMDSGGTVQTVMTLNGAGNLGLGVTPSGWGSNFRNAIQGPYGNYALYADQSNYARFGLASNAFHNGTDFIYVNSSPAAQYQQFDGLHKWYTAASGTAGNAITFTQAMTLDASGNLGVGTTSPSTRIHAVNTSAGATTTPLLIQNRGNAADTKVNLAFIATGSDLSDGQFAAIQGIGGGVGNTAQSLGFLTCTTGGTPTERARITSGGDLLVGTTTNPGSGSGARFAVQSANAANTSWSTYEVDSNGELLFSVRGDGLVSTATTGSLGPYNYTTASAANMYVNSSGQLQRSTSSLKYKKNVEDAVHGLSDLLKLRSVTYEGKAESDSGKTFGGLIAEEVDAAGLTEFVQYAEDGTPDALAYGNMVSLCIKAIQEQQALITSLTARVALLEGN